MSRSYDVVVVGSGFGGGRCGVPAGGSGRASLRTRAGPAIRPRRLPGRSAAGAGDALARERQPGRPLRRPDDARPLGDHRRRCRRRFAGLRERAAAGPDRRLRAELAGRRHPRRARPLVRPHRGSARSRGRRPPTRHCPRSVPSPRPVVTSASDASPLPIAVHFGEDREHPFSGVRQEGCQNLGRCDLGCPGAREEHGRHHLPCARGNLRRRGPAAAPRRRHRTARHARASAGESPSSDLDGGEDGAVEAPVVVLAAGTLGSAAAAAHQPPPSARALAGPRLSLLRQRRRARDRVRPERRRRPRCPATTSARS